LIVSVLALGVGGSVALFDIAEQVLFRPLPFPQAERLVALDRVSRRGGPQAYFDFQGYSEVLQHVRSFDLIGAGGSARMRLTRVEEPVEVSTQFYSASMLELLGATVLRGRLFTMTEDSGDGARVAIISSSLWQGVFLGDPNIVGRAVLLNGTEYRVIGVVAEPFHGHLMNKQISVWLPLSRYKVEMPDFRALNVLARLRSGVSIAAARDELASLGSSGRAWDAGAGIGYEVVGFKEVLFDDFRKDLQYLLMAVFLVLAAGCASVANLLLVQANERSHEWATRVALGCGRSRLIRQCFLESLTLAMAGGLLGIGIALAIIRLTKAYAPVLARSYGNWLRLDELRLGGRLVLIAVAVSLFSCLLFGILPALHATSSDHFPWLRGGHSSGTPRASHVQEILLLFQIAASLAFLTFASSIARNYIDLRPSNAGFKMSGLAVSIELDRHTYESPDSQRDYVSTCLRLLQSLPGVRQVGGSTILPMSGITATGRISSGSPDSGWPTVHWRAVTPGYFDAIGMSMWAGRQFSKGDIDGAPLVAIVNETTARQLWPNRSALGNRVTLDLHGSLQGYEIIGVVKDVRSIPLNTRVWSEVFVPFAQVPDRLVNFLIESPQPPETLTRAVRNALRAVSHDQSPREITPFSAIVNRGYGAIRFRLWFIGAFSIAVLWITSIGVYGIVSAIQKRREKEIGLRMALGAEVHSVLLLVCKRALLALGGGLGVGSLVAFVSLRVVGTNMYGLGQPDFRLFLLDVSVITVVFTLAALGPAIRAVRSEPASVLRHE